MKKYLPYLAAMGFSSIFGFSFLFTKEGLETIGPFQLLAYRFALAALFLTLLWKIRIINIDYRGKNLKKLLILALIQPGLYFSFETLGINLTTSSEAGMMIALIPVVVTILASIFLGEKPNNLQLIFIFISVGGVFFIILMKGATSVASNYLGMAFLLGAVLMAGFYNILSRQASLNFKPVEITFIMMWSGAIIFNIVTLIRLKGNLMIYFKPLLNLSTMTSVIYLGLLSSVMAFFMLNYTLSKLEAARSAVFANLTTVISILAGVIFRGEPFYWFQIVGAAMIIAGVFGTNYYGQMKKKSEVLPS